MASWAALNVAGGASRDHLAQARATEEAQDADNAAMYERALRAQQQHETTEAKRLYLNLLNGHVRVSPRLEYLCNKNIATMEQEAQSFESALDYFAAALALDATDVVVWYQMATCAVETGKWWLARRTLEEGLCVDATYWPLVETLAQVLHQIGDAEAYESVAQYLREKDPMCATLEVLDGHKKRARPLPAREWTGRRRVLKKLQHFKEIAANEGQKRRELQRERKDALERKRQSRRYALQEASWTRLGLVLLEIYEELDRIEDVDVMQIDVEISVGFQQEATRDEEDIEENGIKSTVDLSANGCAEADAAHKVDSPGPALVLETCLIPGMSDNDTQDSSVGGTDVMARQPKRRKSRRHEERLREEHAAAVKKAREVDLAYQLKAFLPDVVTREEEDACALFQWLPPLNVTLVGTAFRVSDADGRTLLTLPSFVLASRTQLPSSQARVQDPPVATAPSRVDCVNATHLLTFLDAAGDARRRRLGDWMRCYLNQCGQWSHVKLGTDGEDVYQVCLWLERALNGELNAARPLQASVITVTDHAVRHSSRWRGTGLSLGAQLFLLEMHFDRVLQQPVRGQRRRRQRRVVDALRDQAQKLLFEFGWREDLNEPTSCPSETEFLRLLWLLARMDERDGSPQRAQQSFMQCRDKFCQLQAVKDDSNAAFCVALPNLKANPVITLAILDEKLSGLRFSDICSEARRLFDEQKHDHVVSILYDHLFPSLQRPRMTDLLHDFPVDGDYSLAQSGDKSKKLLDLVLASMEQSCQFSDTDRVVFLLTTLYSVLIFLDESSWMKGGIPAHDSAATVSLRALAALEYLLKQLTSNKCEHVRDRDHCLVLCGLSVKCLQPSILLRFHSPKDFLSLVRIVLHNAAFQVSASSIERTIEVEALAQLLYDVQSLSSEEVRQIAAVMPHAAKKKQPRWDRTRAVVVELLRYLNLTFQSDRQLACSFSPLQRSALMTLCGRLMKEEEETMARSEAKISKQLFGNGAILFLLLFESFGTNSDDTTVRARLVDLIHLLHDRLGQHGICSARYLSDTGAASDTQCRSCFLDTCSALLSTFLPPHDNPRKKLNALNSTTRDDANAVDDREEEVEGRFQMEVCQCYRCLYDVQILPGCDDHKAGTTFASLQTSLLPAKHDDALRLARFAVPILLATKPKNNGQKKERLKLLYALRDALADSQVAALSARPPSVFPLLEAYLAPRGLLQEDVRPPSLREMDDSRVVSPDERCLSHLWYLLGANFILGRVKRRGNLGELTEMEQHVRERVEFLVKDVLYFHPERIDSWLRLGKTMKELYHAATDAFAAVLGRQERIQALRWYTSTVLATNATHSSIPPSHEATVSSLFSCSNSTKGWDLFTRMKEWQDQETDGHNVVEGGTEGAFQDTCASHASPIATFALTYIMQLIEFAKRCFEMAASLATKASRKYTADMDRKGVENDLDVKELDSIIIECNEECGMLLYNLLQEFSLLKEIDRALFPRDVYSRLVLMAFTYFQIGFDRCELDTCAYETHFRLLYMMGKTLKKKRWCELCFHEVADHEAYASAEEIATCFAKAEDARRKGDREHALVHAFYALQALRVDLTLRAAPSTSALRLVCRSFYLDEQDEMRGEDGTSNGHKTMVSSALIDSGNRKEQDDPSQIRCHRRDEIVALLADAERDDAIYAVNVMLAQGWLALNIIEALDSIPDEDRYFHPSRYVLARLVYWLSSYYVTLDQSEAPCDEKHALLEAIQACRSLDKSGGPSDAAARALKEMAPLFDKRRPQIVTIWFSEYIPTAKKFEELNQRQMKYDYYRLKYWRFYIALLAENGAYGRLKEMGSWVLACKEEHDVIELMLVIVVEARGTLLRRRVQEMMLTVDPLNADETRDRLCKLLAKTYTYYLEVETARQRLTHEVDYCQVVTNAELLLVAVYSVKAVTYPSEDKAASMASNLDSNVSLIVNALLRNEGPPRVYDSHNRDAWKLYVDSARFFCEETWPERSGKGKPLKKLARVKAAACADVASSQGAKMDSSRTP